MDERVEGEVGQEKKEQPPTPKFAKATFNPEPPPPAPKHRVKRHGPDLCGGPVRCRDCALRFYNEEYTQKIVPMLQHATAELERMAAVVKESGHEHQFVQLGGAYEKYVDGKPIRGRQWIKLYCTRCAQPVELLAVDNRLEG